MDNRLKMLLDEKCIFLRKEGNNKIHHFIDVDFNYEDNFDFIKSEHSDSLEQFLCFLGVKTSIMYQGRIFLIRDKNYI